MIMMEQRTSFSLLPLTKIRKKKKKKTKPTRLSSHPLTVPPVSSGTLSVCLISRLVPGTLTVTSRHRVMSSPSHYRLQPSFLPTQKQVFSSFRIPNQMSLNNNNNKMIIIQDKRAQREKRYYVFTT